MLLSHNFRTNLKTTNVLEQLLSFGRTITASLLERINYSGSMRTIKFILFFVSAFAFAQQAPLSNSEIAIFKEDVASQAASLESLSGDFIQVKHMEFMEKEAVSKGKIYYNSPNILKWEYSSPYNYVILFKDKQVHINDNGNKSVTSVRSNKLFEKLINLISGSVNGQLLADMENFKISYFRSGSDIAAVIIPKDSSLHQMFNEIILTFDETNMVKMVKLMESSGDYTEIEFENLLINENLKTSVFEN